MRRAPIILAAVAVALACAPDDRDVRLARLAAERRAIAATFDRLEDRFTLNQARVRFWGEMRERHESVSAIACVVQDEHLRAMAARMPPPARERMRSEMDRAERVAASRRGGQGGPE